MSNQKVVEILKQIQEIHEKKSADYAQEGNSFSNFERAALLASWFNDPVDKIFVTMLGIKLARMAELLNGKKPNNESLSDSFLDFSTYAVLWYARYLTKESTNIIELPFIPTKLNVGDFTSCVYCKQGLIIDSTVSQTYDYNLRGYAHTSCFKTHQQRNQVDSSGIHKK